MLHNIISVSRSCRLFSFAERMIVKSDKVYFQKIFKNIGDKIFNETLKFSANTMKCQCSHNLYEYSCNGKAIILAQLSTRVKRPQFIQCSEDKYIFLQNCMVENKEQVLSLFFNIEKTSLGQHCSNNNDGLNFAVNSKLI